MKNLLTLCFAFTSLSVSANYHEKLKAAYESGGSITLSELREELKINKNCLSVESGNSTETVKVEFKEFVIPEMGPLFPEERFFKIISPVEEALKLGDLDIRDNLNQEDTSTGVISRYSYKKTETQYRELDGSIVFFSKQDWSSWDEPWYCQEDDECDEVETKHSPRVYGYCY